MVSDLLESLQRLYDALPAVNCRGCGRCCVSPTCTLVEFLHLARWLTENKSAEAVRAFVSGRPVMHEGHEGNLVCRLLAAQRCGAHPSRTGACRLFGTSAAAGLGLADLAECENGIEADNPVEAGVIRRWLDALMELNGRIYPVHADPYYLLGLNLECWLEIYFDRSLDFDIFIAIKEAMREAVDLSAYAAVHLPQTGIKEKIDKISLLSTLIGNARAGDLRDLLVSIRDGYPLTGTYFRDEAQAYLRELERAVEGAAGDAGDRPGGA